MSAALVFGMVAAGWTLDDVSAVFRSAEPKAVRDVQRRWSAAEWPRRIRRLYRSAEAKRCGFAKELAAMRSEVFSWQDERLSGKGGATTRQVYAALLDVAAQAGSLSLTASLAQLGELAGVGGIAATGADTGPVRRALVTLRNLGLVALNAKGYGRRASDYTLADLSRIRSLKADAENPSHYSPLRGRAWSNGGRNPHQPQVLHPLWEWAGLGPNTSRVYEEMRAAPEPVSVADLADRLSLNRDTVANCLRRLNEHGLAESRPSGRWPRWTATAKSLDEVADDLGLLERPTRRRLANERRREGYREMLRKQATYRRVSAQTVVDPTTGELLSSVTAENRPVANETDLAGPTVARPIVALDDWRARRTPSERRRSEETTDGVSHGVG